MEEKIELGMITYQSGDKLNVRPFKDVKEHDYTFNQEGEKYINVRKVHSFFYLGNEFFTTQRFYFNIKGLERKYCYVDFYDIKNDKIVFSELDEKTNERFYFSEFDIFYTGEIERSLQNLIKKYDFKPSNQIKLREDNEVSEPYFFFKKDLIKFKERYRDDILSKGTHIEDLLYAMIGDWLVAVPKHSTTSCYHIYYYVYF